MRKLRMKQIIPFAINLVAHIYERVNSFGFQGQLKNVKFKE